MMNDKLLKYLCDDHTQTNDGKKFYVYELCEETLNAAAQAVENDPVYGTDSNILKSVLTRFPENTDRDVVAMKVALIDLTNSTHLSQHSATISLHDIVEFIVTDTAFDAKIKSGDQQIVGELAKCKDGIAITSFASKYCKYHNSLVYGRDDYSILDGIVMKTLPGYFKMKDITKAGKQKPKAITFSYLDSLRQKCDYKEFNRLIGELLEKAGVDKISDVRTKFDYLMWYTNRKSQQSE